LGYFGDGSVNILEASQLAKQYSESTGVDINTVYIDEILYSRRFKHFKYIYSTIEQEPEKDAHKSENVWHWLTD